MTEIIKIYKSLEEEARDKISPSRIKWLSSLKPGDVVASRWRTSGQFYIEEIIKEITIYDDSVNSAISCQFEDGSIVDSFWIDPVSAVEYL